MLCSLGRIRCPSVTVWPCSVRRYIRSSPSSLVSLPQPSCGCNIFYTYVYTRISLYSGKVCSGIRREGASTSHQSHCFLLVADGLIRDKKLSSTSVLDLQHVYTLQTTIAQRLGARIHGHRETRTRFSERCNDITSYI
jgi:hypothetical protein